MPILALASSSHYDWLRPRLSNRNAKLAHRRHRTITAEDCSSSSFLNLNPLAHLKSRTLSRTISLTTLTPSTSMVVGTHHPATPFYASAADPQPRVSLQKHDDINTNSELSQQQQNAKTAAAAGATQTPTAVASLTTENLASATAGSGSAMLVDNNQYIAPAAPSAMESVIKAEEELLFQHEPVDLGPQPIPHLQALYSAPVALPSSSGSTTNPNNSSAAVFATKPVFVGDTADQLKAVLGGIDVDECDVDGEGAFFVADLSEVYRQHLRWLNELPRIVPYYGE